MAHIEHIVDCGTSRERERVLIYNSIEAHTYQLEAERIRKVVVRMSDLTEILIAASNAGTFENEDR